MSHTRKSRTATIQTHRRRCGLHEAEHACACLELLNVHHLHAEEREPQQLRLRVDAARVRFSAFVSEFGGLGLEGVRKRKLVKFNETIAGKGGENEKSRVTLIDFQKHLEIDFLHTAIRADTARAPPTRFH